MTGDSGGMRPLGMPNALAPVTTYPMLKIPRPGYQISGNGFLQLTA